jgi:hypothetical protein
MVEFIDDKPADVESAAPDDSEQLARQEAIKQVKARRLFKVSTTASAVGVALLVPIWAATEYQHAGGWPARGFSQSSGTPNVWNVWIIYPVIAWVSLTAARGWAVYGRKPAPEGEIERETESQPGAAPLSMPYPALMCGGRRRSWTKAAAHKEDWRP